MLFEKWISILFLTLKLLALNLYRSFIFICRVIITSITDLLDGLLDFGKKPTIFYSTITTNVNWARMQKVLSSLILSGFSFVETDISQSQDSKRKDSAISILLHFLFLTNNI